MGIPNWEEQMRAQGLVSIAGGDSWVGIRARVFCEDPEIAFQSQVAILGWGYSTPLAASAVGRRFQSQVAILGWGYEKLVIADTVLRQVSIAGGDSWVGIQAVNTAYIEAVQFQSQVAILGWGY